MKPISVIALAAAGLSGHLGAVETSMTQGGFTGLTITPNAHVVGWGRFDFVYDRQLPGAAGNSSGDNYVGGFGLFPNLEVSGRVAANENPDNCFINVCQGIRDLSLSGKASIGLDARNRFRVAGGAGAVGGAATNFRTVYGVLTFDEGPFQVSGGLARRSDGGRVYRSPLHGVFAGAAWQPAPWLRTHIEYTDRQAWAGVRLFAPSAWVPEGWSAHVGANARLTDNDLTSRAWLSAGVSIPLYKVPRLASGSERAPLPALAGAQQPLPAYEARVPPAAPAPGPAATPTAPSSPPARASDATLEELGAELRRRGFEDIRVGRMADGSTAVRVNNATYNWNSVDAVGAALGGIARVLGDTAGAYRLLLTQRQVPLVAVTGQANCLQRWIAEGAAECAAGELSTPGTSAIDRLHAGAQWVVDGLQPSWRTLRVALSPVLRTNVATEVGVLDYSAGINVGLSQPLWAGATLDWRLQTELSRTGDYAEGGILGDRRVFNGTERFALTQTARVPLERWLGAADDVRIRDWGLAAVTAQATLGRVGHRFDGLHGAVRWEPGEGRHRLTVQGGAFRNNDFGAVRAEPLTARPLLGTYRYNFAPTRTYVEATAGRFMNNDGGFQVGLRQWFGDFTVHVFAKRTQFTTARNLAGLEVSIPLGPRRDMNPGLVQVTGTPRFAHSIETVVGGGANVVTIGQAVLPPVLTLETVHNSDRASLLYFEDNVRRIRDAARQLHLKQN
ncbi:MAG TPA: YjbH domain-containing protein [Ramlibacter sp.]